MTLGTMTGGTMTRGAMTRSALAILLGALMISGPVLADAKAADKAFRKGKKLLAQKRYQEACAAFEDSFREDPAIGAQLNVARCYQEWGKTATAHEAFQEALKLARATKDERAAQIKDLLAELRKTLPMLVVALPAGRLAPPGLSVTIDEVELPLAQLGKATPVDPGPHVVVVRTAEGALAPLQVTAVAGQRTPVELPLEAEAASVQPDPEPAVVHQVEAPRPGQSRRLIAMVVGGAGVLGLGGASLVALDARSDYHEAFDAHCDAATKQCDAEGVSLTGDARSQANLATVIGGVALAAIATGAVLYFTAPSDGQESSRQVRYLRPVLSRDGIGLAYGGSL